MQNYQKFLKRQMALYKNIGDIPCKSLNGEIVSFNNKGLKHLLLKGRKKRKVSDQYRRLILIKHIPTIIGDKNVVVTQRKITNISGITTYWELRSKIGKLSISVIIRKVNHGKLHFYSIFSKK